MSSIQKFEADRAIIGIQTRAVESNFKKSNKSRIPKYFYVVFIRFFNM